VITDIRDFGVFVDLGDVEGVITSINLSWTRFDHPSEIVNVGQRVAVVVLAVDLERMQISLSLKELQPRPLLKYARTCLGNTLQAEVSKVVPFGVFVRPDDGVEGLVPQSNSSERGSRCGRRSATISLFTLKQSISSAMCLDTPRRPKVRRERPDIAEWSFI
jgi:small subunit ribosomal protein S1